MDDYTQDLIKIITAELNQRLGVKTIAVCKGGPVEEFNRPSQQPFIIFSHSENSLKLFIKIISLIGLNPRRLNDVLKSSFDKQTQELRWIFMIPANLMQPLTEQSIYEFWNKLQSIIKSI